VFTRGRWCSRKGGRRNKRSRSMTYVAMSKVRKKEKETGRCLSFLVDFRPFSNSQALNSRFLTAGVSLSDFHVILHLISIHYSRARCHGSIDMYVCEKVHMCLVVSLCLCLRLLHGSVLGSSRRRLHVQSSTRAAHFSTTDLTHTHTPPPLHSALPISTSSSPYFHSTQ
jgi:hypothetical protein